MYLDFMSFWKEPGPFVKSDPILTLHIMFDPYFMAFSCASACFSSICRSQTCHDQTVSHHLEVHWHDKPLSRCCRELMVDTDQDTGKSQFNNSDTKKRCASAINGLTISSCGFFITIWYKVYDHMYIYVYIYIHRLIMVFLILFMSICYLKNR